MEVIQLIIIRIETAATDAIMVVLEERNGQPVKYESGQFFTFIIEHYGKMVRRSYSLISTPGVDHEMAVIIKRRINGEISRYLIDHLKPGDELTALPPAGRFTLQTHKQSRRTIFFIAAGSGISPLFSLLKKVLYEESHSRAVLIYQNHSEDSIVFRNELFDLQRRFINRFVCVHLLSNPQSRNIAPQRLNNYLLEQLVTLHRSIEAEHLFFICGPGSFMRMAHFVLRLMGFQDESIRKENFVIDAVPPPPFFTDTGPKLITLRWKGQVMQFRSTYPESILQAALNNHIHLPYSCRGGRCSTCTVRRISGNIKMSINEVLTNRDLEEGLVLTCVGYAETDLEIML